MRKLFQQIHNDVSCFFICLKLKKKIRSQNLSFEESVMIGNAIIDYTKRLFSIQKKIRNIEYNFLIKAQPNEETKQFIQVPFITFSFDIECCSRLKVIVSFGDDFYVKYKLFEKGLEVGEGMSKSYKDSIYNIAVLMEKNKCKDKI